MTWVVRVLVGEISSTWWVRHRVVVLHVGRKLQAVGDRAIQQCVVVQFELVWLETNLRFHDLGDLLAGVKRLNEEGKRES